MWLMAEDDSCAPRDPLDRLGPRSAHIGDSDFDEAMVSYFDPHSDTMAITDDQKIFVDITKFFEKITELLERVDMDNQPIGLTDIAEQETLFAVMNSGWSEQMCRHIAEVTAAIVHARYPLVAGMPLDERFDAFTASLNPPFEWSYRGPHLDVAKAVMAANLRNDPDLMAEIDYSAGDSSDPFMPLYRTVKSTFELAIAVLGAVKTHPLYQN